ncbi:MAG: hypothetical protein PW789_19015 [Edaphobacter sp.]|uniref:hypothetical protein n=1 Tax=Edaphobacter sp. TaxID=1934404 RepID=UPI00239D4316|nr:hypothetical protein [Edaphobacter sp.]MDE1178671.1 hypothetical protein [Edaphobacter sp.]
MMFLLADALPQACMAGTFHSKGGIPLAITICGLVVAVFSLAKGLAWLREEVLADRIGHTPPDRHAAKGWLLGAWVLVPPAWLFIEDVFLFRLFGKAECFASFQYAQEIVFRGWFVLVAVLTMLYFGRTIFGRK